MDSRDRPAVGGQTVLVIYNPAAGQGWVRRHWPRVADAMRQAGVRFDAVPTAAPQEAVALVEQAVGRYAAVVAAGGDGVVHEVANGLLRSSAGSPTLPIGILPLGRGNDFVKALAFGPRRRRSPDWREAVATIAGGRSSLIDAGRIVVDGWGPGTRRAPRYFVNVMDLGFGAETILNLARLRGRVPRRLAYLAAALHTVKTSPRLEMRTRIDEQPPIEGPAAIAAVANGGCFGRGFWVCPQARIDDGLLDVVLANAVSRLTLLRLLPGVMRGRPLAESVARTSRARRVTFETSHPAAVEADGEILSVDARRVEVKILPQRLRVIM